MEFHFYRLHQETSIILQVWYYLGHSQLAYQAGNFYSCPRYHHVCLFFIYSPNTVFLPVSSLVEAWSLYLTSSIPKVMDKPNIWIRLLSNTSIYIVITSKTTGLNSYLLQSLLTTMLQVLLMMFLHYSLIRDIIQILPFTLSVILLPPKPVTLL